jgi:hypothetical protein
MGILEKNTVRLLRDGRVIEALHRVSNERSSGATVKVRVTNPDGSSQVKKVIVRKVTP